MANPISGYIMVLATTGERTGKRRLVPLNFAEQGDAIYCLAGFGKTTHWLLNLQAHPQREVWPPDGRRCGGRGDLVTYVLRRPELNVQWEVERAGLCDASRDESCHWDRCSAIVRLAGRSWVRAGCRWCYIDEPMPYRGEPCDECEILRRTCRCSGTSRVIECRRTAPAQQRGEQE